MVRRVVAYIWDHLRGRHHIGRSLANAVVAYAAVLTIYLIGVRLFFGTFDVGSVYVYIHSPPAIGEFVTQMFGIVGSRVAVIWGVVGVLWSAVRTVQGQNQTGPTTKLLAVITLALLGIVVVALLDGRRMPGLSTFP